jgi:[acyl-carrier-protein] S-malonyltransferase
MLVTVIVVVAPGQGAQAPGFLIGWMDDTKFAQRMNWLSAVCDLDLAYYGTRADAATIQDTAITQPLLVAAGLTAAQTLFPDPFRHFDVAAGHSVGELTVAAGTGVISAEQAVVLARERGREMSKVAADGRSGMTAILGGDPQDVATTIQRHGLTAVNYNASGHIVVSGTKENLARLDADPPAMSQIKPLRIAGGFHTKEVACVADVLGRYVDAIEAGNPCIRLLSNRDGEVVSDGADALARLVKQVSSPVRWDLCQETMTKLGVTGLIELPPAGTLAGIARRVLSDVETFALESPDQLDDARAFVDKHAEPASRPDWDPPD